MHRYVILS